MPNFSAFRLFTENPSVAFDAMINLVHSNLTVEQRMELSSAISTLEGVVKKASATEPVVENGKSDQDISSEEEVPKPDEVKET